jgi:hypothetical protein
MKMYEAKINGRWIIVKAKSMQEVNSFDSVTDWKVCGMMSRSEMAYNKANAPHISEVA